MTPDDFPEFCRAVHGFDPFPWQSRLVRQVSEGDWPSVMALPTAAGKTSAIDVAVFTLALQAGKSLHERTAPLRVFFVIDRRLVVDQAAEHARKLRQRLESPGKNPVLREAAQALRRFGGPGPLHVAAMRGGMYRDDSWAKAPNQPTVSVTTVDQVGSRLLFRGYGLTEFAWPLHAALTGNDALYLVDEAHLSEPFLATLKAVRQFRQGPWAKEPLGGPFRVVEISATPQGDEPPFVVTDEDRGDEELSRRLMAPKPAVLLEPTRFEQEAAQAAVEARSGEVKIVGVVVNRVASARDIFSRLPGKEFEDKVLLTGRIRPWDRDRLLPRFLGRVRAGRERRPDDRPLFVAATMTVEVGADLDFDYLVTEAAPLASLRQRFGRLDRLGRFGKSAGAVLLRKAKGPDPIYGDDLTNAWHWLRAQATGDDPIDFGVQALEDRIRGAATPPPATTPRHCPVMFPAHLDSWVQTSPAPQPTPDVSPFLHGPEALDTADVQVVWRADLVPGKEDEWLETVAAAPPRSREALSLPVQAVRAWLSQVATLDVADLEGVSSAGAERGAPGRAALRWRGPDAGETRVITPSELRPGDTVVVPAVYGGADAFGWNPDGALPVADVGDLCVNDMANRAPDDGQRRLIRLRLYPDLVTEPPGEGQENLPSPAGVARRLRDALEAGDDHAPLLDELLSALALRPPADPLLAGAARQMFQAGPRVTSYPAGVILTARVPPGFLEPERTAEEDSDAADVPDATDSDDSSSLRGGTFTPARVSLQDHTRGVEAWVETFVQGLGLPADLVTVLKKAARLHDLGKADWRFQTLLYGDEPGEELLAKSGKDLDARQREAARQRARLPRGFRHELVSVALLQKHGGELLGDLNGHRQKLIEYLVGTHHGRGRPFPPFIEEDRPEEVAFHWDGVALSANPNHGLWRLDSGWADEFWQLTRRYGYWGLAYLEAILRLADGARSAEEQRQQEVGS